jgi:hypothetical protein
MLGNVWVAEQLVLPRKTQLHEINSQGYVTLSDRTISEEWIWMDVEGKIVNLISNVIKVFYLEELRKKQESSAWG